MDRSKENQRSEGKAALDRHVRELHEHTMRPMPPMQAQLGHHALEATPPESVLDIHVYGDGTLDDNAPPANNQ